MCEVLHEVNVYHLVVGDFEVDALPFVVLRQDERSDAHCQVLRHGILDAMVAMVPHQEDDLIAWRPIAVLVLGMRKAFVEVPRFVVDRARVIVLLIAFLPDDLPELVVLFNCHNLPTINVVHFSQSVVDATETATAYRAIFLELTTGNTQQVANRLDVVSIE